MKKHQQNGLVYYQFEILIPHRSVSHGIFGRIGGTSGPPWASLNVGYAVGDDTGAVDNNHERICAALGIPPKNVATANQVHGRDVGIVTENDRGRVFAETDALVSDTSGVPLMLRFADCLPIVLFDPERNAVGLAHAGWRGTVKRVARQTVLVMQDSFNSDPGNLIAGIGPGIGPCCYEVGEDVIEAFEAILSRETDGVFERRREGLTHLDLSAANALQLRDAGVRLIERSDICTACRTDVFYSHRAEAGQTGRFAAVVGLKMN